MKKILLLGGSSQQIVAIETAKRLGYFTILCDYLEDNPGQYYSDKFYLVSTTDKEAILDLAIKEEIDGVLAYASDPAAPTAAYVAEKLGLNTNPYNSVEILCNKDLFRSFLDKNGFNAPKAKGYSSSSDVRVDISDYKLPIIIKPVDSSGSKGATVLRNLDELEKALDFAFSFSRSKRIVVEEFIEKKHPYLIGGDIFIKDGKVILWGLMNCHRDLHVNPLVPVGKSYPLELEENDVTNVKNTLKKMISKLGIKSGAINVELIVDKNNRVWPIDVGPRNGGNMIPDLLGMIFDIDIVEMSIKAAMGIDIINPIQKENELYYATHNLHSSKSGLFKCINYSKEIDPFILKKCIYKTKGDKIEYFDNAAKAIGIIFFKFNNKTEMNYYLENINNFIDIVLED